MARRVVVGGFRATCVLASAVSTVATRSIAKVFETLNPATSPSTALRFGAAWQRPMESLEPRQLLAGVTMGSDGILTLVAPWNQGNTINVYTSGSNIVGKVNATSKSVSATSVNGIKIVGGNWNDTINVNSAITKPTSIYGGDGNEKIYGGSGPDKVYGNDGHESVFGNGGNDSLFGEAGNDTLDGGSGTDSLVGGYGTDVLKNGEAGESSTSTSTSTTTSVYVSGVDVWDTTYNKKI